MKSQEAIKYLKQIQQKYYPSEGISWKDDQYIEAINMAIAALVYDTDPVRDDLEQKAKEIATKWRAQGLPYNAIHEAVKEMVSYQWQAYVHLIWKLSSANYEKGKEEMKQQLMGNALEGIYRVYYNQVFIEHDWREDNLFDGQKIKIIVIKED